MTASYESKPVGQPALRALLQDQQRLKQEADKAHQLATDAGDELASARERMQQMQAELKGVKDTAQEQLQELGQLKVVGRLKIQCCRHRYIVCSNGGHPGFLGSCHALTLVWIGQKIDIHEEHNPVQETGAISPVQTVAELSNQRTQPGKEEQAQQSDATKELKKVRKAHNRLPSRVIGRLLTSSHLYLAAPQLKALRSFPRPMISHHATA